MKAGVGDDSASPPSRDMAGVGVATAAIRSPEAAAVAGAGATIATGGNVRAATTVPRTGESESIKHTASTTLATAETRHPAICRRWLADRTSCTVHHFGLGTSTASAAAANVAAISPCSQP